MERLIAKYTDKLIKNGLAIPDEPLFGTIDSHIVWNKKDPRQSFFSRVLRQLNINSILFSPAAQPYQMIIDYLGRQSQDAIFPQDIETRTFLHELPITREWNPEVIAGILKKRKSVIIPGQGIVTFGTVSPEQAFVTFSSICFAVFVKFFVDFWEKRKNDEAAQEIFHKVLNASDLSLSSPPVLKKGPFASETEVIEALIEAGAQTVAYQLVDSYFGNISYLLNDTLYISQTGSSLDELAGVIDACPLDNSRTTAITASSEFSTHKKIVLDTDYKALLHGHPRFAVIISLICDQRSHCPQAHDCHRSCAKSRRIKGIPIVPGEFGTGPAGLYHTVPPAIKQSGAAIVYGHGVFTTGKKDFNEAFNRLLSIEKTCRDYYFSLFG